MVTERSKAPPGLELVVVVAGNVSVVPLPVSGELILGRTGDADVVIDHPSVSRRHARLLLGSEVLVEDLESANGTRLSLSAEDSNRTAKIPERRLAPRERTRVPVGATLHAGSVTLFLRERAEEPSAAYDEIIAASAALEEPLQLLRRFAPLPIHVLLLGETGVGKEVFARALHRTSPRASGPFVAINCGALSPSLVESELFGHERGSFTGASHAKVGLLESADGGTVLLDEVGELPLLQQAKLLRVLEERSVQRVGAVRARPLDVRFVAATNRDLESDIERGLFRRDLFFRLNGVTITLPPLRQRPEDIAPLARHFAFGLPGGTKSFSAEALERLQAHDWPGNVRELKNVIERAGALCSGSEVRAEHLLIGTELPRAQPVAPPLEAASSERERIIAALNRAAGNQTRAAELLGISRRTLVTRLRDFAIPRPREKRES